MLLTNILVCRRKKAKKNWEQFFKLETINESNNCLAHHFSNQKIKQMNKKYILTYKNISNVMIFECCITKIYSQDISQKLFE